MSHVAQVECQIRDLHSLQNACDALGLKFDTTRRNFKWFGRHVGDYPLPKGFNKSEMGKCDIGVISDPNSPSAYEVGVCTRRDGKPGYALMYDSWQQNRPGGIEGKIGAGADVLTQRYAEQTVRAQAARSGMMASPTEERADGSLRVLLRAT